MDIRNQVMDCLEAIIQKAVLCIYDPVCPQHTVEQVAIIDLHQTAPIQQ